jgi:hypothetical protein
MTATLDLATADLFALPVTDDPNTVFRVGGMYVCEASTGLCCPRTYECGRRRIVAVVDAVRTGKAGNLLDLTIHDQVEFKGEVRRTTYTKRGVRCRPCRHIGDREMTIVVDRNSHRGWYLDSSRAVALNA